MMTILKIKFCDIFKNIWPSNNPLHITNIFSQLSNLLFYLFLNINNPKYLYYEFEIYSINNIIEL